jgi:hypothetical protein
MGLLMLGRQEYKTAELPVTEASACEVQMAIEKLKKTQTIRN